MTQDRWAQGFLYNADKPAAGEMELSRLAAERDAAYREWDSYWLAILAFSQGSVTYTLSKAGREGTEGVGP